MGLDGIIREYNVAIFDTDCQQALSVVRSAVEQGISPEDVVFKIVLPAMDLMVKGLSEDLDVNLAQHFLTARIADIVTAELIPKFTQAPRVTGRVVIGTAHGDFHTLGKRLVMACLKARMIEVLDLGVNVSAEKFVEAALAQQAHVIGVSALMVHTAIGEDGPRKVRQLLSKQGLGERIKLIVGGAPFRFDPEMYKSVGADTCAADAITAGKVIAQMLEERR